MQKAIEDDKIKESSKIREARQARVQDVSQEGEKEKVTIILNHSNGKEEHQFIKGAYFQDEAEIKSPLGSEPAGDIQRKYSQFAAGR